MKSFKLEILTPENKVFDDLVTKIFLRTEKGDIAIMAGHIPIVTLVKPCECRIEIKNGKSKKITLSGGVLSVFKDKTIVATY